ncbi:MAG: GNAT family N-acetyltransferase [Afipia sp.]|nr:GNAT family N-acetyltransferase [Afipia sp.]
MTPQYQFRPMTAADLPLVQDWLTRPHVAEWWHDGDELEFVSGDLAHHDVAQFIVTLDGRPLGYLQCYQMSDWDLCFGPQPAGTRGIDQFIGEAEFVGRGHGSAFIRQFIDELLTNGTPRIVIDPSPSNPRAIRAYEKAGFQRTHVVDTPDGPALLMVRNP